MKVDRFRDTGRTCSVCLWNGDRFPSGITDRLQWNPQDTLTFDLKANTVPTRRSYGRFFQQLAPGKVAGNHPFRGATRFLYELRRAVPIGGVAVNRRH